MYPVKPKTPDSGNEGSTARQRDVLQQAILWIFNFS